MRKEKKSHKIGCFFNGVQLSLSPEVIEFLPALGDE